MQQKPVGSSEPRPQRRLALLVVQWNWLSVRAEADLVDFWVYSAGQWNFEQTDRYIDALVSRFEWLCDNPQLWKPRQGVLRELFLDRVA